MFAGSLRSAHSYSNASGCIYEAAQELIAAGHPVDVAVVGARVVYRGEEQIKPAQVDRRAPRSQLWALAATDFTRPPRPDGGAR